MHGWMSIIPWARYFETLIENNMDPWLKSFIWDFVCNILGILLFLMKKLDGMLRVLKVYQMYEIIDFLLDMFFFICKNIDNLINNLTLIVKIKIKLKRSKLKLWTSHSTLLYIYINTFFHYLYFISSLFNIIKVNILNLIILKNFKLQK